MTVEFEIGIIAGGFTAATGALTLSGEAGGILTSGGESCWVSTDPEILTLSSADSSGGPQPLSGAPFTWGLTGAGAIAGEWDDMRAEPVTEDYEWFCGKVDERIGGPGGIWLEHEGDIVPPEAPHLTGTDPASPSLSGAPRILGLAEAGSTVRVYASPDCAGAPVATGSAAALGSPGFSVEVAEGITAAFSASATDAAGNTSTCSAPISYTRLQASTDPGQEDGDPKPTPACIVPKLTGKTLAQARRALKAAHCKLGKVGKPRWQKGKRRVLVVKSSNPRRGARPANGKVHLKLGPKPRKARR